MCVVPVPSCACPRTVDLLYYPRSFGYTYNLCSHVPLRSQSISPPRSSLVAPGLACGIMFLHARRLVQVHQTSRSSNPSNSSYHACVSRRAECSVSSAGCLSGRPLASHCARTLVCTVSAASRAAAARRLDEDEAARKPASANKIVLRAISTSALALCRALCGSSQVCTLPSRRGTPPPRATRPAPSDHRRRQPPASLARLARALRT